MKPNHALRSFLLASCALLCVSHSHAVTITWDANGTGANQTDGAGDWTTAGQWWDGATNVNWTSGDNAIFGLGGTGGAVTLTAPTTIGALTFNSFTGTYTLGTSGQAITLNSGITMNSGAGNATLISPITLGAAQSWTNNSAGLLSVGTGAVTNGGFLLTVGGTGNTAVSGAIGGAGGLTKNDAGILTLTGANGYTGATTVSSGVLNIQHATALGTVAGGVSVTSGAALEIQGGITVGAEALALNGTGLSNAGALRNISGTNIFKGLVTLGSATRINSDAGLLTFDVASGNAITGTYDLTFGGSGNITVADIINIGTGTLTKDGTGTLTISGGYLSASTPINIASGATLTTSVNNTFSGGGSGQGAAWTIAGTINSSNSSAAQTMPLSVTLNNGTMSGTTFASWGTFLSNGGAGTTITANGSSNTISAGNIGMASNLTFNTPLATDALSVSGYLGAGSALAGGLIKNGLGTVTLAGASNSIYTGTTTVNAGVLNIRHAGSLGTTAGGTSVSSGAALQIQNGITTLAACRT